MPGKLVCSSSLATKGHGVVVVVVGAGVVVVLPVVEAVVVVVVIIVVVVFGKGGRQGNFGRSSPGTGGAGVVVQMTPDDDVHCAGFKMKLLSPAPALCIVTQGKAG